MAKKKSEGDVRSEWSQLDVDLMYWNYAVGVCDFLTNDLIKPPEVMEPIRAANRLLNQKRQVLEKDFKKAPSFIAEIVEDKGNAIVIKKPLQ